MDPSSPPQNLFDRLPSELLSKIFQFVTLRQLSIPAQMLDKHIYLLEREYKSEGPYISPLSLCGICQRWRAVAFSAPSLRNLLQPIFQHPLDDGYELELVRQWLKRSGKSFFAVYQLRVIRLHEGILVRTCHQNRKANNRHYHILSPQLSHHLYKRSL